MQNFTEKNEKQTYADIVFISSEVDNSLVGSITKCSSALRCLQRCGQTDLYITFYFSVANQKCYCNTQVDEGAISTVLDTGFIYGFVYEGSQYLPSERLHVLERDCLALYQQGFSADGVYSIYPISGVQIEAWCDMTGGGWTVIQRRQDGSENFNRTWDDYVNGFGNKTGEYWLGLENMRILTGIMTTGTSTLRIELETFGDVTPVSAFAEYSSFVIGSSATNYQLTVGGFSGSCGDSLTPRHNGMAFSTLDRDNDIYSSGNCALMYKGAWWYSACHYSNLNGMYLGGFHNSTTVTAKGMVWYTCWRFNYSVKKSVMKIRRNS